MARKRSTPKTKQNFDRAAKRIEKLAANVGGQAPSGLRIIGEEIMLDCKTSRPGRGVPVDTGVLRSTGRVEGPKDDVVTLSFGGAAATYALVQHEDTTLNHHVGEARYMIRAVERWEPNGVSARRALGELQKAIDDLARTGRK